MEELIYEYTIHAEIAEHFEAGFLAAHALLESREKKLVEALRRSQETLEAVIEGTEQWTLEQERLGNKGICIPAINRIKETLASLESKQVDENESGVKDE